MSSVKRRTETLPNVSADRMGPAITRVYNAYRTSLLNVKYYGYKLKLAQRVTGKKGKTLSRAFAVTLPLSPVRSWDREQVTDAECP